MEEELLSPRQLRRSIGLLLASVVAWTVFGAASSGSLLTGMLLSVNFTPLQIGYLMSLTLVFLPMQLVGSWIQMRFFHRKHFWVTLCAIYYCAFVALAVVVGVWEQLPKELALTLFFFLFGGAHLLGNSFNATQLAWQGDIIPAKESNRFWTRRTGLVMSFTVVSGIALGVLTDHLGRNENTTYAVVLGIGMAFAFLSLSLSMQAPDPIPIRKNPAPISELLKEVWKDTNFKRLTLFFAFQSISNWLMCGFIFVYLQRSMNFSQTAIQILLAISGAVSFLSSFLFTVFGNRYGRKPLLIICSTLKVGEFICWGFLTPGNGPFDLGVLKLLSGIGVPEAWIPPGFVGALPVFLLGGFVNMGLTAGQFSLLTSLGKKESLSFMIGFFFTVVGLFGAISSACSGVLYDALAASVLPKLTGLNEFNLLSLLGGVGYLISILFLLPFRESGAAPTVRVVRSLLAHNPFRTIYQALVLATPIDEQRRAEMLRDANSELSGNELVSALRSYSARVRESALLRIAASEKNADPALEHELLSLLRRPKIGLRPLAVRALGKCHSAAALPELLKGFDSADGDFALACIYAAGTIGNESAAPALRKILETPKRSEHHAAAAEALSRIGGFYYAETILRAYEKEDDLLLARQSLMALCRCFDPSIPVVRSFEAEEKNPGIRIEQLVEEFDRSAAAAAFERNDYTGVLEPLLLRQLSRIGVALPPEGLGVLLKMNGRFRDALLEEQTPAATALRIQLKLWGFLRFAGSAPDRFELLAALLLARWISKR